MGNKEKECLLVGVGLMGQEYAPILNDMGISFEAIGRGDISANAFETKTKHHVYRGGLKQYLSTHLNTPEYAIVATGMEALMENTLDLLHNGIKNILVEKPAGINQQQIYELNQLAIDSQANVYVAYNRRFYASTLHVLKCIEKEGGVTSFTFDFTEWSNVITSIKGKLDLELNNWFYGNSTHVIDMAFYLGGKPKEIICYTKGNLAWHPNGSRFSGAGVSNHNAPFSYHANWDSAGRWGVEIHTVQSKYIFRPLEKLQVQKRDSISSDFITIDDTFDTRYKPGLFKQTEAFFEGNNNNLKTIQEQLDDSILFDKILYN